MSEVKQTIEQTANPKAEAEVAQQMSGTSATGAAVAAFETVNGRVGHYRWVICALLFFATTINYVDRQVFGFLAPDLQRSIGWNEAQYGWIVFAFTAA